MPTLKELLEQGNFKYGTDYRQIEPEKQTVSDFEQNGLRPDRLNIGTDLYGTETLRITRQSTSILDDMKANANANQGLLGGVIGAVRNKVNNFASKVGFPVLQIPTRVSDSSALKSAIKGEGKDSIPEALAKIKEGNTGGALGIVGKFLSKSAEAPPKQVGRRALSTAANIGKDLAKNLLFGTGETGQNTAQNEILSLRNKPVKYASAPRFNYSNLIKSPIQGGGEKGLLLILQDIQSNNSDLVGRGKFIDPSNPSTDYANPGQKGAPSEIFPQFPEFSLQSITQNIPDRRGKVVGLENDRYPRGSQNKTQLFRIDKPKGKFNTTYDTLTSSGSIWESEDGTPPDFADGSKYEDYDFIPLNFYSVSKKKGASFKATINGLSENFSPSWESSNFIGNPYSIYNYQTIDRDLTFSFSIYSLSSDELKKNWEKIDFLSSLVYPQNTTSDIYVTPPLLKVTLGNMYKNKLGFIETLSYTIEDNTPWEIGIGAVKEGNRIVDLNNDMKNYKLPTIINVSVSYQIIETSNDVVGKKLYAFGTNPVT